MYQALLAIYPIPVLYTVLAYPSIYDSHVSCLVSICYLYLQICIYPIPVPDYLLCAYQPIYLTVKNPVYLLTLFANLFYPIPVPDYLISAYKPI